MADPAAIVPDSRTMPRIAPKGVLPNLIGMSRDQMRDALVEAGAAEKQVKMRVGQIWGWLYQKGVGDPAQMTNLSKDLRALIAEGFRIERPEIVSS